MLVMSKDEFEEVCKGQYDTNFAILSCNISVWETNKWFKCWNEQIFSDLNFIKTKIWNWLIDNLALCVHMFEQSFFTIAQFF